MRSSQYIISTLRETPADAEIVSHQLMVRAGLIRKLASGLYSWMPLGLRVLRKVEAIVREEMDAAGALELLMPAVQPAELWKESGRWEKYEQGLLLKLYDRHQRDFCFGPTHEEVITDIVRNELRSHKQLPVNFYQIQVKFRDEIRPRFGVMRAREFLMKDAYSFHLTEESLRETYQLMYDTYSRIFSRMGLEFRAVQADSGDIGGSQTMEFHVLADSGEDAIVFSTESDYAANIEMARSVFEERDTSVAHAPMATVDTPAVRTIEEVCDFLGVAAHETAKTLIVHGREAPLVALVLRGDHTLNQLKAGKMPEVATPFTMATDEEIRTQLGFAPGFIGPVGLPIPCIVDHAAAALTNFVCGANANDRHHTGVNWERDCKPTRIDDLRDVKEGDPSPDGKGTLAIKRGIEVGQIFQLGTLYTSAMGATVLNEEGRAVPLTMGCYGIGVSRTVAAVIEQCHDERGIIWPDAIAPFNVVIVPINLHRSEAVRTAAERIYADLIAAGIDVLLDDREERPGVRFADAELIGIPHRIVIGDRGLAANTVEYVCRRNLESREVSLDEIVGHLVDSIDA